MADERIVLSYDPAEAIAAADKANKAIEGNEKAAERAVAAIGKATEAQAAGNIRVLERGSAAIQRWIDSAKRKVALTEDSPSARLRAEKELYLKRVQGDAGATEQIKSIFDSGEAALRLKEQIALLEQMEAALNRVSEAAKREGASIEAGVRSLEHRAAVIGLNPQQRQLFEAKSSLADLINRGATPEQIERASAAVAHLSKEQVAAATSGSAFGSSLLELAGRLGLVIGGAEALKKAFSAGLDATLYAARTKQLEGALLAVAKANGVAETTALTLVARLKGIGIVTQDAEQAIARLIAAQVDYTKSEELARAAQNLGRVAGISSSEAFDKLTHAIVTQQPELLRTLGLNVNLQQEFQSFARQTGRTAESLSEVEKKHIALNATLAAAAAYNGVYKRSLNDAGGQLLSLKRYVLEAKDAFGQQFLPELEIAVSLLTALGKSGEDAGEVLAKVAKFLIFPPYAAFVEQKRILQADGRAKKEAEQIGLAVAASKTAETASKALQEQEALREKQRIAALDAEKRSKEELQKADERALDFLKSAQIQELEGLDRIAQKRRQALDEFGKTPTARANIEKGIALERNKFLTDFEKKRQDAFEAYQTRSKLAAKESEGREFDARYRLQEELGKLEDQANRVKEEQALFTIEARKASELRAVQEIAGKTIEQRLAAEDKVASIEQAAALKTFALKVDLINREANLRASLAGTTDEKDAILKEAAARAELLAVQTQAAVDTAQETAAVRKLQIVRTEQERLFESVRHAAEGIFDALLTRTRSLGDVLKNLLLQAVLTPLKQIASTAVAAALTGGGGGGGLGAKLGLGGLLTGGIARAGAPGGTPGFAGPVGGLLGAGGIGGSTGSGVFGGGSGLAGIGGLGLAGAGLGLFGAFKAGQSDNRVLKGFSPAIGALSGLVGFGALAYLFPSLLAAGPAGWIAAAGIGAAVGLIGIFKRKGEDKLIEKIKAVYGITVDRSFARNPLLPIIKDQFGGDIDTGIRSPIVRELLATYRMQSNQAGLGYGLGAVNNVARGVSLTGYNGSVYQSPVNINGGAYGYGGSLPSSGPAEPFGVLDQMVGAYEALASRPVSVQLQIDGRDVQASVARTNQASVGRREATAVLIDPLATFG